MSDVANLELCEELYKLSGWYENPVDTLERNPKGCYRTKDGIIPAYDLGYLLRKLPQPKIWRGKASTWYAEHVSFEGSKLGIVETADTPEDAACKLAIELFKQGVLKP